MTRTVPNTVASQRECPVSRQGLTRPSGRHRRAGTGAHPVLFLAAAQVQVVLQQQAKQFPPGRIEVFFQSGVRPGGRRAA
ncbi:hypothetical protein [Streptacidiphilus rugosus]|uniref:hypothetical protein n=1 Tax=Streptacidiphilus rugosus TaxID=405783 RepID=UPI0012F8C555|nr:hypothetical protein [Streptacidiphilus rugosus]